MKNITLVLILLLAVLILKAEMPLFMDILPQKTRYTKESQQQQITEYMEKYKSLGLEVDEFARRSFQNKAYYHRINLNAYDEFLKEGADLKELAESKFSWYYYDTNYKLFPLISDVIVVGTIVDYQQAIYRDSLDRIRRNTKLWYGTIMTVQIDDWIKGKELYAKPPKTIKYYSYALYYDDGKDELVSPSYGRTKDLVEDGCFPTKKGQKVIFFCNRIGLEEKLFYDSDIKKQDVMPKDVMEPNVFIDAVHFVIRDNQVPAYKNKLQDFLSDIKKIININDDKKFYQRSYK